MGGARERASVRLGAAAILAGDDHGREPSERRQAAAILTQVYESAMPPGPTSLEEIDGLLLVAAWFRRHAAEQAKTLSPDAALAVCRSPADTGEETVLCPSARA